MMRAIGSAGADASACCVQAAMNPHARAWALALVAWLAWRLGFFTVNQGPCTMRHSGHRFFRQGWRLWGLCFLFLGGCTSMPADEALTHNPPTQTSQPPVPQTLPLQFSAQDKSRWEAVLLPGKLRTLFTPELRGEKTALKAQAKSSASMLRQRLHIAPEKLGTLQFEWQVEQLIDGADMSQRDTEDSPVRLILVFDGDRSRFSAKNALLSELTHGLTGEPMPYATLMYVWCNACTPESVIVNPRTDRVRKLPLESGPAHLGQWRSYRRDIRADFEKAFGEAPGALLGLAIMTDTDNTRSTTRAWYGAVRLE